MSIIKRIRKIREMGRGVLSDKTILEYNAKNLLIEGILTPQQIQPNSIDLTLGNTWKKPRYNNRVDGKKIIDPSREITYKEGTFTPVDPGTYDMEMSLNHRPASYYILQPGEFVLMASYEKLNIPNGMISFVQGRSSIARMGIQTEQAGFVDAGFKGTITFEVNNQSKYPIKLYSGMRIAQVYFFKAQYASNLYGAKFKDSKYQMQIAATGSKIHLDPEIHRYNHISSE